MLNFTVYKPQGKDLCSTVKSTMQSDGAITKGVGVGGVRARALLLWAVRAAATSFKWKRPLETSSAFATFALFTNIQGRHISESQKILLQAPSPQRAVWVAFQSPPVPANSVWKIPALLFGRTLRLAFQASPF